MALKMEPLRFIVGATDGFGVLKNGAGAPVPTGTSAHPISSAAPSIIQSFKLSIFPTFHHSSFLFTFSRFHLFTISPKHIPRAEKYY
jgi:hypothetical protein